MYVWLGFRSSLQQRIKKSTVKINCEILIEYKSLRKRENGITMMRVFFKIGTRSNSSQTI